jgi:hypothetical protein
MADQSVALTSAQIKHFGPQAGFVKYTVATMATGSGALCELPKMCGDITAFNVMTSLGVGVAAASYSWALVAGSSVAAASLIVTCASGTILPGSIITALVVM